MITILMDYTTPSGATIEVRRGYIKDQFIRNVYTLLIECFDSLGQLIRRTAYEIDHAKRRPPRLITQQGTGVRCCDPVCHWTDPGRGASDRRHHCGD